MTSWVPAAGATAAGAAVSAGAAGAAGAWVFAGAAAGAAVAGAPQAESSIVTAIRTVTILKIRFIFFSYILRIGFLFIVRTEAVSGYIFDNEPPFLLKIQNQIEWRTFISTPRCP
jgi:CRP-like cAMP-binding protein